MLDTRAPPKCRLPRDTRHNDPAEIEGEASVEKAASWLQCSQAIRIAESADNLDHFHEFMVRQRQVTKHDIATLSNDIVAGKFGKPSVSNARHMRKAASGLFNWAAEAGRDHVTASPCGQTKTPALSRRARNPTTVDLNRDDYEERSKQSATITWQSGR
ncbi:hypothetical protein [Bradyrhizobium lupini]|uniref:hypothetical protein n=1 Tax=Rhizobium lupini TaxID=136996 RepID=UPI0034C69872